MVEYNEDSALSDAGSDPVVVDAGCSAIMDPRDD